MNDLLLVAVAGLTTWLLRASFIAFAGSRPLPGGAADLLRHARPAVLAALVVSSVMGTGGTALAPALLPRVAGIVAGGLVAWRWGNLLLTLGAGFAAFWALELVLLLLG